MVCIYCAHKTTVTNSRPSKKTPGTWRRRHCTHCGAVFTTREYADLSENYFVRYEDNTMTPFSRDNLFISIYQSCRHRKTALEDAEGLTNTIITKLLQKPREAGILITKDIIIISKEVLGRFDPVAETYYGAYYS